MATAEFQGVALDGLVVVTCVHGRLIDVQVESEAIGLGYDTLCTALQEAANDALAQAADAVRANVPGTAETRARLEQHRRLFAERLENHNVQARVDQEFFGEIIGRVGPRTT